MALNPALDAQGFPLPFAGELLVLRRTGIEFHLEGIPSLAGAKWRARGILFLSSVRMVFVSSAAPTPGPSAGAPPLAAFDIPLLFLRGEKFNQPIFGCNNISGEVLPVDSGAAAALSADQPVRFKFTIFFTEGGVGTFLPLFFNLLHGLRAAHPAIAALASGTEGTTTDSSNTSSASRDQAQVGAQGVEARIDPVPEAPPAAMMESLRSAYVDPNDPTIVYLEQPVGFRTNVTRRRGYTTDEASS